MNRRNSFDHVLLLLLPLSLGAGCALVQRESEAVDSLVAGLHSDDFAQRQSATVDLLSRDAVSLRYVVIPRLALESARKPLEVSSVGGNVVRGRVTGGDESSLQLETTGRVARGAGLRFTFSEIKAIRLFSP